MADPVVTITNGVPTTGTGIITTLGQTLIDGANATHGITTGAAVTTNAAGTFQQYLRGLVTLFTAITVKAASTAPAATDPALVIAVSPNSWDTGTGTSGTKTQRVILDGSQLDPTVAHGTADSGAPYKQGFKSTTSLSAQTMVSTAQRTDGFAGVDGVQIMRPHCNLEDIVTGRATDTAGTSTACIAAQAAGIKTYLTSATLANSSATAVTVNILDGASIKYTLSVPAGSGNNKEFTVPIPGTAATAWNFQTSAAATTVTCSMIGFKSKV